MLSAFLELSSSLDLSRKLASCMIIMSLLLDLIYSLLSASCTLGSAVGDVPINVHKKVGCFIEMKFIFVLAIKYI